MAKKTRNIKRSKHDKIVQDYDNQKRKHLERQATKMLKDDERNEKLKEKDIKTDFFDKF
jgi:hypothetical protein